MFEEGPPAAAPEPAPEPADGAPWEAPPEEAAPPEGSASPRRKLVAVAVAVGVALAGIGALALFVAPGHPFSLTPSPPPGSGAAAVTFQQAYNESDASVSAVGGGPWTLVTAAGFDSPTGFTFLTPNNSAPGCAISGSIPSVPASSSAEILAESSPFWTLGFIAASTNSTLSTVVTGTGVDVYGPTDPTAHCEGPYRPGTLVPIGEIPDSSTVVSSLTNLSTFVADYAGVTAVFSLSDEGGGIGRISDQAIWAVSATPCANSSDPFGLATSLGLGDPVYYGGLNATHPRPLVDEIVPGIGSCEFAGTLGPALTLGFNPTYTTLATGVGATFAIRTLNRTVTTAMFHPVVVPIGPQSGLGGNYTPSQLDFRVLEANGSTVAEYNFTSRSWSSGTGLALTLTDQLELILPDVDRPQALVLVGDGSLAGDVASFVS